MPHMAGMTRVPFSAHAALSQWQFGPFAILVMAVLLAAAVWYLRGVRRLSARGRRWSGLRTLSFMVGIVAVDLALQSPVVAFTAMYFQAHVAQHLLLMVVAPPLLAMGAPMTLLLQTSTRRTKSFFLGVLNSRPFRIISHPISTWFFYYFAMFAFFLTFALGFAMQHMWIMDLSNIAFLFGATLFWWPIVGLDPIPHWRQGHGAKMVNLLIGVPVETFLGLALLSAARTAAPMYSLASTHAGGGILWVGAEIFTVIAFVPVFISWMRAQEREGARFDARQDATAAAGEGDAGRPRRSAWLPPSRVNDVASP